MTRPLHVVVLYNAPVLAAEHADYTSEAGVLESVTAIAEELRHEGHQVSKVAAGNTAAYVIGRLEEIRPDVVVNLCESFGGSSAGEAHLASLLELVDVPYTGGSPECLALARNKPRTKRLLAGGGVLTPEFIEVGSKQVLTDAMVGGWLKQGPLIVKPAEEDASLGMGADSVTVDWESLVKQVTTIQQRYGKVMIERYIAGREFTVGIVEVPDLRVLPISEVEFQTGGESAWPIVTYASKWSPGSGEDLATPVRCPALVEPKLAQQIEQTALAAYCLLGCRDYVRVDLRVDSLGKVYVLEVNANPDLGPTAGLARMLRAAGIEYREFAERLVETAMQRQKCKNGIVDAERIEDRCDISPRSQVNEPSTDVMIRKMLPEDRPVLVEMTRACDVFRPDEVEVAEEVLGSALKGGPGGDYYVCVAEFKGRTVGWSCHGRVPMTDATFDLYWIVVAPDTQGRGIGRRLLAEVEQSVVAMKGRWLLAETSSTAVYDATRQFYGHCGYQEQSRIEDFYRLGDGRITFGKRLG